MDSPGLAVLDRFIGKVKSLPKKLPALTAARAVKPIESVVRAQIAAGTDPDGNPWRPTKDGKTPESHAMGAVKITTVGSDTLVVVLSGYHVYQHYGWGKVKPRPIIPSREGGAPDAWSKALQRTAAECFQLAMGGA